MTNPDNVPDTAAGKVSEYLRTIERGRVYAINAVDEFIAFTETATSAQVEVQGTASEMILLYRRIYDADEALAAAKTRLGKLKDRFKYNLIPEAFERENINTLTTSERDRVSLSHTVRASIPAANREQVYAWLRANGHESMIQQTVNASTLSAWAAAELSEMRPLPPEIVVNPVTSASLTRGKGAV